MGKTPDETEYVCLMPGTMEHALLEALISTYNELDRLKRIWWGKKARELETARIQECASTSSAT